VPKQYFGICHIAVRGRGWPVGAAVAFVSYMHCAVILAFASFAHKTFFSFLIFILGYRGIVLPPSAD